MSLSSSSLVLVAIVNKPRDLEIARILGWYRIPLRTAPKVVAVDYLAFYQTSAFGDGNEGVYYIAPGCGHELTTRAELLRDEPDHPRAREEYFKIQLGPLQKLPTPIAVGKWHRMTFLYTTGEYLLQAKNLNDLVVQTEERKLLWQALRERAQRSQDYRTADLPELDLDPAFMEILLGISDQQGLKRNKST